MSFFQNFKKTVWISKGIDGKHQCSGGAELLDKPFKREAMARAVRATLQRGQ